MKRYDANGVKPRFDGKGSEFGFIHRALGRGFLMFDIDRLSAIVEMDLELRRENEGFVEYRQSGRCIRFVALFEIKKHKTKDSVGALDNEESSTMARNEMAKLLGCRLFVVFATDGKSPFEFWEFDQISQEYELAGTLTYKHGEHEMAIQKFWRDVLGIPRYFPAASTAQNN